MVVAVRRRHEVSWRCSLRQGNEVALEVFEDGGEAALHLYLESPKVGVDMGVEVVHLCLKLHQISTNF